MRNCTANQSSQTHKLAIWENMYLLLFQVLVNLLWTSYEPNKNVTSSFHSCIEIHFQSKLVSFCWTNWIQHSVCRKCETASKDNYFLLLSIFKRICYGFWGLVETRRFKDVLPEARQYHCPEGMCRFRMGRFLCIVKIMTSRIYIKFPDRHISARRQVQITPKSPWVPSNSVILQLLILDFSKSVMGWRAISVLVLSLI